MNEMNENQMMIAHFSELEKLQNELQTIESQIENAKKKGWLKAIFPLQVEYAIILMKIKSFEV